MIRGKFMTSKDDIGQILDLRRRVFVEEQGFSIENERDAYDEMSTASGNKTSTTIENERDAYDEMAIYALVYDENDEPAGTGRLFIDADDHFAIGRVCVLKEKRGLKIGDLIMRMLLYRAREMNAPEVYLSAQLEAVPFYRRYGFAPYGDVVFDEGVPHRLMRVAAGDIDIEGGCEKKSAACGNCGDDCGDCENK